MFRERLLSRLLPASGVRKTMLDANSRAPTFLELATAPGMTIAALSVALTTPHAGMPMFRFTTEQREDVIAYILSLR
jgi:mono/diheme cytochrome c family protein